MKVALDHQKCWSPRHMKCKVIAVNCLEREAEFEKRFFQMPKFETTGTTANSHLGVHPPLRGCLDTLVSEHSTLVGFVDRSVRFVHCFET